MSLIYIAGPSGTGKSTVRNELIKRGYEAYDTDEDGMSAWYNNQTLELIGPDPPAEKDRPADWYEKHDYRMSAESVKALADRAKSKIIFLCGLPANDSEFLDYYDKILCLVVGKETVRQRIATRTTNSYGKSPDELKFILHWHDKIVERYKNLDAIMIDAEQPLDKVVDNIVEATEAR